MCRSQRWAVAVEVTEVVDRSARFARRSLPEAAAPELDAVRESAAAVERIAQTDPPTSAGFVFLDRLVPMPGTPPGKCGRLERPSACSPMRMLSVETSRRIDLWLG
jgi:hypothetical protein